MSDLPAVAAGYVRLLVHLSPSHSLTPGALAQAAGIAAEFLGPINLSASYGYIDVLADHGREARSNLQRLGPVQLSERNWVWLRLSIGRNHGLGMGQFRKVMFSAGAGVLGRIVIQNTHTMVGLPDDVGTEVAEKLSHQKVNGYPVRPTLLDPKAGPGSPEFVRGT
jgi:hypothetical protein